MEETYKEMSSLRKISYLLARVTTRGPIDGNLLKARQLVEGLVRAETKIRIKRERDEAIKAEKERIKKEREAARLKKAEEALKKKREKEKKEVKVGELK